MKNTSIYLGSEDKSVITGKINVSLDFHFDMTSKELVLGASIISIDDLSQSETAICTITRTLTRTEKVYYLLLLGSGPISENLVSNSLINVLYNGKTYQGLMHSQTRGRVSKLQPLYTHNPELLEDDVTIKATYDIKTNTLSIEKC